MYIKNTPLNQTLYRNLANCIRILTIDAVERANSGHPGMPLGMADVATVLFSDFLEFNPKDPKWLNRDRFVLSAGHGSMLLYSLLYLTGYEDISLEDIKNFRQLHSPTAGHPEYGNLAGIECTTGPLGQGLATAVGMAMAQKIQAEKLGSDIINNYTYVIVGDGCLMEGISHEAASLAGHLKLDKLIVLFDSNDITIDGKRSLSESEHTLERFKAYNWEVDEVDGHDSNAIYNALAKAKKSDRPVLIKCNTVIGFGSPNKSGKSSSHGSPLGKTEATDTKKILEWEPEPFHIPDDLLSIWRNKIGARSHDNYTDWNKKVANLQKEKKDILSSMHKSKSPENAELILEKTKEIFTEISEEATRVSSKKIIEEMQKYIGNLYGGSADLTGSNGTKTSQMTDINKDNFLGNYINYGVREHAMGAAMNGLALYGGIIPYAGTFLVFSDYARPSIRLSALMKQRVIYVMTHDSIGLGEDGPTHHPVEHLASLRAMPNLNVLRPADGVETAECWDIALTSINKPSILSLTRQNVRQLRNNIKNKENLCRKGAYIISECNHPLKTTIFATGSEVQLALDAQEILEKSKIGTRVISVPSMEIFDQQPKKYRDSLLDNDSIKVGIEAAVRLGWDKYIGRDGIFIGMSYFGESAPAEDLYKYFNITSEEIVKNVVRALKEEKSVN